MFGHQDDQHHHHDDDHKTDDVLNSEAAEHLSHEDHEGTVVSDASDDFNPALPATDNSFSPAPAADPVADDTAVVAPAASNEHVPSTPGDSELLNIKQQVLTSLSPLVDHLDQTPEEKFRTTMMMIQASDNQELIKTAYDAAQNIPDEKVKAQALLDIVNEINYFTQQNS